MQTFFVTNENDSGAGSLRQAVEDANAKAGADRIEFTIPSNSEIELTGSELTISDDVEIDGDGQIIDANENSRIFNIDANVEVTIDELLLTNGFGEFGGAILNQGQLLLRDSTIKNNTVASGYSYDYAGDIGGSGAGIYNRGTAAIINSIVSNNFTGGYGVAGGIHNTGVMSIEHSSIDNNGAGDVGGILNTHKLYIAESEIDSNGGYFNGGIINTATLHISKTTISNNGSVYGAGGIANGGFIHIDESLIYSNVSIFQTGGGIRNSGEMLLQNTTISSNSSASFYDGGGIYNRGGSMAIEQSTITGNMEGALVNTEDGHIELSNSVFSNNPNVHGASIRNYGTINLNGTNIVDDGTLPGALAVDPLLGPLQDNGGPTLTHALLPESPAINAGDPNFALPDDQRGFLRDANPDIGAFEFGAQPFISPLDLVEHQAVSPALVHGVDPEWLVGQGMEVTLELVEAVAAQHNSLGYYWIDDDGGFKNVTLLDADISDTPLGTEFSLGVIPEDQAYGLFLVKDGFGQSPLIESEGLNLNGALSLVHRNTGAPGTTDSTGPLLLKVDDNGNDDHIISGVPIFHASGYDGPGNPLNLGGDHQALSWLDDHGTLTVAFEDVTRGGAGQFGWSDNDFNDAVFELYPVPHADDVKDASDVEFI